MVESVNWSPGKSPSLVEVLEVADVESGSLLEARVLERPKVLQALESGAVLLKVPGLESYHLRSIGACGVEKAGVLGAHSSA